MSTEIGYQHILIPLDGSPESEAIFPYIVPIALQFHSRVTLIEVLTTAQSLVLSTSDLTGGAGVVDPNSNLGSGQGSRRFLPEAGLSEARRDGCHR